MEKEVPMVLIKGKGTIMVLSNGKRMKKGAIMVLIKGKRYYYGTK